MTFCLRCGFNSTKDAIVERDGFKIDPLGLVWYNGERINLTPAEVCILHSVAKAGGRPVPAWILSERCCTSDVPENRAKASVREIRTKMKRQGVACPIRALSAWSDAQGGYYWAASP